MICARVAFLTSSFFVVQSQSQNPDLNERCEIRIMNKFPDALCQPIEDLNSCEASCKDQGKIKCGDGLAQIRKLQCRKSKDRVGPISCCCRIKCKRE